MHEDSNTLKIQANGGGGFDGLGGFGGGGLGLIALLALLGRGRGLGLDGCGDGVGLGGAAVASTALLNGKVDGLELQVAEIANGQKFAGVLAAINAVSENFKEVNSEIRTNTAANNAGFVLIGNKIDQAAFAAERIATTNTQAILNAITQGKIDCLTTKNIELADALSNEKQTHHLEHSIRRIVHESLDCFKGSLPSLVQSAVQSGNSFGNGAVASGNGSNNNYYEIQLQNLIRSLGSQVKAA